MIFRDFQTPGCLSRDIGNDTILLLGGERLAYKGHVKPD